MYRLIVFIMKYDLSKPVITEKLIYQEYCEWNTEKYHYERRCPRYKKLWKIASNVIKKYNIKLTHYNKKSDVKHNGGTFDPNKNLIFVLPPRIYYKASIYYLDNLAHFEWDGYADYYYSLFHELAHAILFHNNFKFKIVHMEEVVVIEAVEEFFKNVLKNEYAYNTRNINNYYKYNKETIDRLSGLFDVEEFNKTKEECKNLIIDTFKNYLTIH